MTATVAAAPEPSTLSVRQIVRFWLPLAGTWFMMSLEGPILAAVIARLADPKPNLAAYGVAFAFAIIIESPVILLMSASTALVHDRASFLALRRFTYVLNAIITAVMLLLLVPAVFDFVALTLVGLPADVAAITHGSMVILLLWPGAIGDRRFHQGVLIRADLTRRVAYGTAVRLLFMLATALATRGFFEHGAHVGAAALVAGVLVEALATRLMVRSTVRRLLSGATLGRATGQALDWRSLARFYYPLALTSMLSMAVQPTVTFFMGQSRMALDSLAVLPVINSLAFVFRSVGLSFQEAAIALLGERGEHYQTLRRFALGLGLATTSIISLIAFTPLSGFWFGDVSGLSPALTDFSRWPLRIIVLMPALSMWLSFQRALLVHAGRTEPLSKGTLVEVVGIALVLVLGVFGMNMVGAIAAMTAIMVGRVAGNLYLVPACRVAIQRFDDHTA